MKQLIPPISIKRNFEEDSEFLEYLDNLDNDEDQSNSSNKLGEKIYESDDDDTEFTNQEMYVLMRKLHRARKIPQEVQKSNLLLT